MNSSVGNEPTDLLHLPGIRVIRQHETDDQFAFEVEVIDQKPERCCAQLFKDIVRNGTKERRFRDLPVQGKYVEIIIDRQKYKCRSCGATVYEMIPGLSADHRMTERLVEAVARRLGSDTHTSIAREFGLSEGLIRGLFREATTNTLKDYDFELPRVLGIDEKHLLNGYRCVIGNVEERCLLEILPTRFQQQLHLFFSQKTGRDRVEVVCQDMHDAYRQVARKNFPKAMVIVDKFHVVRMANEAVERIRRNVNKDLSVADRRYLKRQRTLLLARYGKLDGPGKALLEDWFDQVPILREAYWCKERFFDIYDQPSGGEAARAYREWEASTPTEVSSAFAPIPTAMKRWSGNIFAYFDHGGFTNAYTESVNRLIGDIQRAGRGYSFEVLRAKALLAHGIFKVKRPRFARHIRMPDGFVGFGTMDQHQGDPIYLGVPIDWLSQQLRSTPDWFATIADAGVTST